MPGCSVCGCFCVCVCVCVCDDWRVCTCMCLLAVCVLLLLYVFMSVGFTVFGVNSDVCVFAVGLTVRGESSSEKAPACDLFIMGCLIPKWWYHRVIISFNAYWLDKICWYNECLITKCVCVCVSVWGGGGGGVVLLPCPWHFECTTMFYLVSNMTESRFLPWTPSRPRPHINRL